MITRGNFSAIKRGSVGGWKSYYYTTATNHICALRGNKWLKFDNVSILSLSLDNGATYPITLDLTGVTDIITRSKIYPNGNIMFAGQTKCYVSTNNLATYQESVMTDINGNPWVASELYDQFKPATCNNNDIIVNGVFMDIFTNYSIDILEMNIWYSIDSGISFKSCFKNNYTIGGQNFRHNHGITYNPTTDKFLHEFGDALSGWNLGTYNWNTDTWTSWVNLASEDGSGYHKTAGVQCYNGYTYWTSDSSTAGLHGVWKCPNADIGTGVNYTKIRALNSTANGLSGINGVMIAANAGSASVNISVDYGVTWEHHNLSGGPNVGAFTPYIYMNGPDSNGFYRSEIIEAEDSGAWYNYSKGIVLMIQIIATAGSD